MKKRNFYRLAAGLALALLMSFLLLGVSRIREGYAAGGKLQLEAALRRAAVACYATEGRYPPSLAYLTEHYGVQIDEDRYLVFYEVVAENWMPEITVLEKNV